MDDKRLTLNLSEVAKALGICRTKIYELAKGGALPFRVLRLGKRMVVSKKEFFDYLSGNNERWTIDFRHDEKTEDESHGKN